MELSESLKTLFTETAKSFKSRARWLFMARTAQQLGPGGQRRAEREQGWHRLTIRKGIQELTSGFVCLDAFGARGRRGGPKSTCRPSSTTSAPSSTARVKPPRSFVRNACLRG